MPAKTNKRARTAGGVSGRLREFLRGLNLSGYEIGKTAGVYRSNVTDFLDGRKKLSGESIDRICEAYGFQLVDARGASKRRPRVPTAPAPAPEVEAP